MKRLKLITLSILSLILLLLIMFTFGCLGGRYNQDVLNELEGRIIYTRRDSDSVLKIYTAKGNLQDEQLLYEHHDSIGNGNIVGIHYDEENDCILFEAYDDTLKDWGLFQLDTNLKVIPLGIKTIDINEEWYSKTLTPQWKIISKNGDLYLSNLTTTEETLLKDFYGMFDIKFSPGYVPLGISPNVQFVFYGYSKHATPFGLILEALINPDYQFQTYVLNVQTGQKSLYVNFEDIIFIPEPDGN